MTKHKGWRDKMFLWLTTMNYYHTAQRKPESFTPKKDQKFEATNNLFRGTMVSALHSKYVDLRNMHDKRRIMGCLGVFLCWQRGVCHGTTV